MSDVPNIAIDSVKYLMSVGASRDVAIAIVSVLYAGESKLNPGSGGVQTTEHGGVLNPNGAYGIAQWNGPRQQKLADFAKLKRLPVDQVNTQLSFVLTEMANDFPELWRDYQAATITYDEFVTKFVMQYERPKDPAAEISRSRNFAVLLADAIGGEKPPVPPPAPPAPLPTPVGPVVDKEIAAIEAIWGILQTIDQYGCQRVLAYLRARLG